MSTQKRGLGRGLDALLGDAKRGTQKPQTIRTLPIEFLQRGKYQPRLDIDTATLQELADSIQAQGIIQPIVVRPIAHDKYEIIAGERRWRAAALAQLHNVPVVIKDIDDKNALAVALIENIQREDLNALEEALALKKLLEEFSMTHKQIAQSVGKSRATVSNLLRLLELPPAIKTLLTQGAIEMGHARALLAVKGEVQIQLAKKVVAQGLTVRAVEKLITALNAPTSPAKTPPQDTDTSFLAQSLSSKVGAKVAIKHQQNGKGRLIFAYNDLEQLQGIIERIK